MTREISREEILAMPAGRELDIAVAQIMGYTVDRHRPGLVRKDGQSTYPKRYSTDISASWEVVEKMRNGYMVQINTSVEGNWRVNFSFHDGLDAYCDTAPLAICHAALLTTMEETP